MIKGYIVHPATQHSMKAASELNQRSMLAGYITTVYNNRTLLNTVLKFILPDKYAKKLNNKYCQSIDSLVKSKCAIYGLVYLFLVRFDKNRIVIGKWLKVLNKMFSRAVLKELRKDNSCKFIIGYDLYSCELFLGMKKAAPQIKRILDMTSIPVDKIVQILVKEQKKMKDRKEKYYFEDLNNKLKEYDLSIVNETRAEIAEADMILVGSSHVKKILIDIGIHENKVKLLPYGVEVEKCRERSKSADIVKFIFVGRVECAKGIFYLLEAFAQLKKERKGWQLTVVGDIKLNKAWLEERYSFCKFKGAVDHSTVLELLRNSDVFVLPSLYEGFSLSIIEAMSQGLPVIASKVSGAEDIVNKRNGILINEGSVDELLAACKWFVDNKNEIQKMSIYSKQDSKQLNWNSYGDRLITYINELVEEGDRNE